MSIKQAIEALEEADALLALGFNVENQIAEALTALRSMPAEPEPFAWATFDGEGSYDLRLYQDNENYRDEYLKRNGPQFRSWVTPLYATPHTAPVPPDWSEVGRLLDAVSAASAGRYMVGTTNWAAFICRQMKQATPHTAPKVVSSNLPLVSTAVLSDAEIRDMVTDWFDNGESEIKRGMYLARDIEAEVLRRGGGV